MSDGFRTGWIVTFYSWKGGVGRSMALANTAVQLARRGARVLMVDWDLEAPGLERYFTEGEAKEKVSVAPPEDPSGMLGLMMDAKGSPESPDWLLRSHKITVPSADSGADPNPAAYPAELHLLPSGSTVTGYGTHLAEFSWNEFYSQRGGAEWLEKLRRAWRESYDFVLIDSRTGLTDSSGICTVQMPDVLVLVFTASGQSLDGGVRYLRAVQESRRNYAYDRAKLAVVPLLSRWDGEDEVDLAARWLANISEQIGEFTGSWLPKNFTANRFLERTRVPHLARFSFGEPLPVVTHSLTDSNLPGLAYENLARLIYSHLEDAGKIIDPSYEPPIHTAGYEKPSDLTMLSLVRDPVALQQEIRRITQNHGESTKLSTFLSAAGDKLQAIGSFQEAEPLLRRALEINEQSFGKDHPEVANGLNNLATLLQETNRLHEAELLYRRALEIGERSFHKGHPKLAAFLNNLAGLLRETNRLKEAEPLQLRALEIDEQSFGKEHPEIATDLNNLAALFRETNRFQEAEPLFVRALEINERFFGKDHPHIAPALNNLADLLRETNRFDEAEPLFRRALEINERSFGEHHPEVAIQLNNLALLLHETNRLPDAEPLYLRALEINERSFGKDHPKVAKGLNNLGALYQETGRLHEAESLYRRALEIDERSFGKEHPEVAADLNNLARLLRQENRLQEAEPLSRRHLEIFFHFTRITGHQHPHLHNAANNYAAVLSDLGLDKDQIMDRMRRLNLGEEVQDLS